MLTCKTKHRHQWAWNNSWVFTIWMWYWPKLRRIWYRRRRIVQKWHLIVVQLPSSSWFGRIMILVMCVCVLPYFYDNNSDLAFARIQNLVGDGRHAKVTSAHVILNCPHFRLCLKSGHSLHRIHSPEWKLVFCLLRCSWRCWSRFRHSSWLLEQRRFAVSIRRLSCLCQIKEQAVDWLQFHAQKERCRSPMQICQAEFIVYPWKRISW